MSQIAETLSQIKTGKRKFKQTDEALSLCKEMFDAGYEQGQQQ